METFGGHFGQLILCNSDDDCDTRTIARDEKIYPNADEFRPERFMEPVDAETARRRNPSNYVFGFGRRFVSKSLQYAECPDALIKALSWSSPCGLV